MDYTSENSKLSIRPNIPLAKVSDNMHSSERFQNTTLRPIIKLQNDLLLALFKYYIRLKKGVFLTLAKDKQAAYIEKALLQDPKIRAQIIGVIIGHFTVEEYLIYQQNTSAFNKRIVGMVRTRILSWDEEIWD